MIPKPQQQLTENSAAYETLPLIKATGFREYDARWIYGKEINGLGLQAVGMGLGTLIGSARGEPHPIIIVGHDYRSYSTAVKQALIVGLLATGCEVHDIGLAITPMAYFAQSETSGAAVAMVTASHNENGWTGIKMGLTSPLTFAPDEIGQLRDIVLNADFRLMPGGSYHWVTGVAQRYADAVVALASRRPLRRRWRCVVACGNGTAGLVAPLVLERLGIEVIELDCTLDHHFPHYNPNPEDIAMLHAVADRVRESGADLGLAFDGDGDRCGIVDETGREIFADRVGLALARDLAVEYPGCRFVVDIKSTGLFAHDPILQEAGCETEYWKTGHSYIKRRLHQCGGLAGFEKSGHFFFAPPLGRGYDDALIAAAAIVQMLDRHGGPMSTLIDALPPSWNSPTMSPYCSDDDKYEVVAAARDWLEGVASRGEIFAGQKIRDLIVINGVRVVCEDGSWGLIRASSNKPELVVVVESPISEDRMRAVFASLDSWLTARAEVGEYNQKL